MNVSARLYAEPTPHFLAANSSDLTSLRQRLAAAEAAAARATTWPERTRAEQDVKIFTRELHAAETQRRRDHAQQSRPLTFQDAIVRGVEQGRFMPTKPYFAAQADAPTASELELEKITAELKDIQRALDDPAMPQAMRVKLEQRITTVRVRIEALTAALNPQTLEEFNRKARGGNAANAESPHPVSFDTMAFMVNAAREAGLFKR